jgi:hypothetical protein
MSDCERGIGLDLSPRALPGATVEHDVHDVCITVGRVYERSLGE